MVTKSHTALMSDVATFTERAQTVRVGGGGWVGASIGNKESLCHNTPIPGPTCMSLPCNVIAQCSLTSIFTICYVTVFFFDD